MARYFMSDTRLGWLERMMQEPPNPPRPNTAPKQKGHQKHRPRCNTAPKRNIREGGV